jgi:hypothetical protein
MAPNPITVKIDQRGQPAGTAGQSRDDLELSARVTLTDPANSGLRRATWLWALIATPEGSAATLAGSATKTATFTPDVAGTYLIKLTVTHGGVSENSFTTNLLGELVSTQGGAAVKLPNGVRIPAAGETKQFNPLKGWHPALDIHMRTQPFKQGATGAVVREGQAKVGEVVAVTDFYPPVDGTWRTAIVNAMAYLGSIGGGTLWFPARSSSYDVDNTDQGAISWDHDGIWWVGASPTASVITNTSTNGADLIRFNGGNSSIQRCGWRNLRFVGETEAGHIWGFTSKGISYCRFENLWVRQKARAMSIMSTATLPGGQFESKHGMFENQWVGGIYEHGDPAKHACVPAFDLRADANLVTLNKWQDLRVHCHDSRAPFFRLEVTSGPTGPYLHQNEWRGINCEDVRRGFAYLAGCAGSIFEDITFYDVREDVDGHLIETATGSGGRRCEQTAFRKVRRGGGRLVDKRGTPRCVTSLTRRRGTATAVCSASHGFAVGQRVNISGASPSGYNGRVTVLSVSTTRMTGDTFTYAVSSDLSSPATGTIDAEEEAAIDVTSLTQSGGVATAECSAPHGFAVGQRVFISGALPDGYNGRVTVVSTTRDDTFTYAVSSDPSSPATGTIAAAEAAMDIKIGPSDQEYYIESCLAVGRGKAMMEADLNDTTGTTVGHRADSMLFVRQSPTRSAQLSVGGGSGQRSTISTHRAEVDHIRPRGNSFVNWAPSGYLSGLGLVWESRSRVRIAAGRCRSDDDSDVVDNTTDRTIRLAPTGAGGLDTDKEASSSTWYDAYLIWDSTGSSDPAGLACVAGNPPEMPSGYDKRRRVGSFYNDSAGRIRKFAQRGMASALTREIWWDETLARLTALNDGSETTATDVLLGAWMPPQSQLAVLLVGFRTPNAGNAVRLVPASFTAADWTFPLGAAVTGEQRQLVRMPTSSVQSVSYSVSEGTDSAWIYVLAWEDEL